MMNLLPARLLDRIKKPEWTKAGKTLGKASARAYIKLPRIRLNRGAVWSAKNLRERPT